jgi:hypothetical protein
MKKSGTIISAIPMGHIFRDQMTKKGYLSEKLRGESREIN